VVGIDQSAGMLAQARAKGLAEDVMQVGLQELPFVDAFDAVMTIDALENVPPEEWPLVVANVRRALKSGAPWYLTIEESDEAEVDDAFARHTAEGLPIVRGEVIGRRGGLPLLPWTEPGADVARRGRIRRR
jgi:ubiquinone/menaquinone biosynthesis C-methylase UbiE